MPDLIRELLARTRAFLRPRQQDQEFDAEMATHLELAIDENLRRGLSPAEARRCALVSIGGIAQSREQHRESRGLPALDNFFQDLRYSVRTLRRDSSLTLFAVMIVALGVGASSTIFSVSNALLLRPLPFRDPARLVWIANGTSANLSAQSVQVDNLLDLRAGSRSLSGVAAYSPFYGAGDLRLSGSGEPERLTGVPVTQDFFPLLGIEPQVGRLFSAEECQWQAPKAVILSYRFWQRQFSGDAGIVGRPITLNGAPATVIGVLPEGFDFGTIFAPGSRIDLFSPFPLTPETNRRGNSLALIGRLNPGATLANAQSEAGVIAEQIRSSQERGRNQFRPRISTLRERVSGKFRSAMLILAGAVALVMLIVCANLSNLLLARATSRRKEMAIRAALGAGRRRLVRQMLTESVALACGGAVPGLLLALGGTRLLARLDATNIPLLDQVRLDPGALAFTLLMAVVSGIVFGMAPALQVSSLDLHVALKDSNRGSTGGRGRGWKRGSLVVCEIALACVLLTSAGLLLRSLLRVLDVDLGFQAEGTFAIRIDPGQTYRTIESRTAYFDEALRHVKSIPGVESAGLTDALPLGVNFGWRTWSVLAKGQVYANNQRPNAFLRVVGDGYRSTMRIPLRAGRDFTAADDQSGEPVMMINETLARTLWPGENPLGRVAIPGGANGADRRVVGVLQDVRYLALDQEAGPEMYLPIRQVNDYASVDLVVRGTSSLAALAPMVRAELRRMDPNFPASELHTIRELVDRSVFSRRFVVLLLAGFAGFGLLLASLGIYAVISYSVNQRRQEIGIRMALGASAGEVQARVLMQTLRLAAMGMALGMVASWLTARGLQGMLFGVTSSDPLTFLAMLATFVAVASLAGYLPARRASRLDPLDALRAD